jgi:hypothetical protein
MEKRSSRHGIVTGQGMVQSNRGFFREGIRRVVTAVSGLVTATYCFEI